MIGEDAANRHIMYNKQLEYVKQLEEQGKAYVIQPNAPLKVGTLEKDLSKLESIYQLGYKQGLMQVEDVKKFMQNEE